MITIESDGTIKFELFMPRANSVHVTGSFNDWSRTALPMQRLRDGWWMCHARLPLGEHQFQYLIDNREWLADFAAHGVELNGYGCWVSQLRIEAPRRARRVAEGGLPEPFVKPAVRTGPLPPVAPARTVAGAHPSVSRGPSPTVVTRSGRGSGGGGGSGQPRAPRTNRDAERGHHAASNAVEAGRVPAVSLKPHAAVGGARRSRSADHASGSDLSVAESSGNEGTPGLAEVLRARRSRSEIAGAPADTASPSQPSSAGGSGGGAVAGGANDRSSAACLYP